jgi:sugar porter (SP) family MFS transporter
MWLRHRLNIQHNRATLFSKTVFHPWISRLLRKYAIGFVSDHVHVRCIFFGLFLRYYMNCNNASSLSYLQLSYPRICPYVDRFGRKRSMLSASLLMALGITCQLLGYNTKTLLFGRLIAGIGTGLMTNAVPLYQSEIAPPDIRGRLISAFSLFGSFGQMIGYFVTFFSSYLTSSWSWRTPWLVQLAVCLIFSIAVCFLPYSPRWLIHRNRDRDALAVLSMLYNLPPQNEAVQCTFLEFKSLIEAEKMIDQGHTYKELFQGSNLTRTIYSFFISIATCFAGNVIFSYYAPQIFKNAGLNDVSTSLALTGGIGFLSLVFTAISSKWWIDSYGRRVLFFTGSAISAACMIVVGLMFQFFSVLSKDHTVVVVIEPYAQYTIILCIYIFSASFAGTWGVANYAYTAEIFNTTCRAKGLSLTYAISWGCSIIITYCAPFFLAYSVSGVHFFFGGCSILTFICIRFIPETKGKTLEEIDFIFEHGINNRQ